MHLAATIAAPALAVPNATAPQRPETIPAVGPTGPMTKVADAGDGAPE